MACLRCGGKFNYLTRQSSDLFKGYNNLKVEISLYQCEDCQLFFMGSECLTREEHNKRVRERNQKKRNFIKKFEKPMPEYKPTKEELTEEEKRIFAKVKKTTIILGAQRCACSHLKTVHGKWASRDVAKSERCYGKRCECVKYKEVFEKPREIVV